MVSLCQSQQRCMKASIVSSWRLAEAQDQLGSLGVHSSESLEQERARTLACPTELTHTEEEWRRKESMLGSLGGSHSPVLGAVGSWDVFDKVSQKTRARTVRMGTGDTFTSCSVVFHVFLTLQMSLLSFRVSSMSKIQPWKWTRTSRRRLFSSVNRRSDTLVSDTQNGVRASDDDVTMTLK